MGMRAGVPENWDPGKGQRSCRCEPDEAESQACGPDEDTSVPVNSGPVCRLPSSAHSENRIAVSTRRVQSGVLKFQFLPKSPHALCRED